MTDAGIYFGGGGSWCAIQVRAFTAPCILPSPLASLPPVAACVHVAL